MVATPLPRNDNAVMFMIVNVRYHNGSSMKWLKQIQVTEMQIPRYQHSENGGVGG